MKNLTQGVLDFRHDLAEINKSMVFLCHNFLNRQDLTCSKDAVQSLGETNE
jgi:hypothetical protein